MSFVSRRERALARAAGRKRLLASCVGLLAFICAGVEMLRWLDFLWAARAEVWLWIVLLAGLAGILGWLVVAFAGDVWFSPKGQRMGKAAKKSGLHGECAGTGA